MYFGDDFLLTSYFRPYVIRTLTYLDCFTISAEVLRKLFQYGQFSRIQVCCLLQMAPIDDAHVDSNNSSSSSCQCKPFPLPWSHQKRVSQWKARLILQSKVVPYAKAILYVPDSAGTIVSASLETVL
jgi:hypothetical protein